MRGIDASAADYAALTNDIFSYQKEIELEGDLHNGVLVVENFLGCTPAEAVRVVNDLMTSRMQQFEHLLAHELPGTLADLDLDQTARRQVDAYIQGLQLRMSGTLAWHRTVDRYKESELRRGRTLALAWGRPTGLGTSAARIAWLFRGKLA